MHEAYVDEAKEMDADAVIGVSMDLHRLCQEQQK